MRFPTSNIGCSTSPSSRRRAARATSLGGCSSILTLSLTAPAPPLLLPHRVVACRLPVCREPVRVRNAPLDFGSTSARGAIPNTSILFLQHHAGQETRVACLCSCDVSRARTRQLRVSLSPRRSGDRAKSGDPGLQPRAPFTVNLSELASGKTLSVSCSLSPFPHTKFGRHTCVGYPTRPGARGDMTDPGICRRRVSCSSFCSFILSRLSTASALRAAHLPAPPILFRWYESRRCVSGRPVATRRNLSSCLQCPSIVYIRFHPHVPAPPLLSVGPSLVHPTWRSDIKRLAMALGNGDSLSRPEPCRLEIPRDYNCPVAPPSRLVSP